MRAIIIISFLVLFCIKVHAQSATISGKVSELASGMMVEKADVFLQGTTYLTQTDGKGRYVLKDIPAGTYILVAYSFGRQTSQREITLKTGSYIFDFEMEELKKELQQLEVIGERDSNSGIARLRSVEGSSIYEAKKTEVIVLKDLVANLSTNNSRQIFSKVPGLNIWENDGAGLQLGIGARGLDPNRTSNFNVRQNGYDISADALGYPESYYTPPTEAIDRIEVVRGAASLQYGTQFGGLLNFVMKKGPKDKPFELTSRQTVGSFGLLNSFNSVGGTKGKVSYYTFFQHKQGDGWRPNSGFNLNMGYASVTYSPSDRFSLTTDFTKMHYLAQQPGGLTDTEFETDPSLSKRDRNWFQVDWNLFAVTLDYTLSDTWKINSRTFGLLGGRDALGNLGRIDRPDDLGPRDLFADDFRNIGNETRLLHHYVVGGRTSVFLAGIRYYHGLTLRSQGNASSGDDADFRFNDPRFLEGSDYDFNGNNVSLFAENIFNITDKFSVTPGIRFERIQTKANGYYRRTVKIPDPETGIAVDSAYKEFEDKDRVRSFVIAGLGLSYKSNEVLEFYSNFSQNYRAINFNDIRVVNSNLKVDEDIQDERGYNLDLGVRGGKDGIFNFDLSLFFLKYEKRIGTILQSEGYPTFHSYRYRTNIGDSRHLGIEAFAQVDLLKIAGAKGKSSLLFFGNIALIDAEYTSSGEKLVAGNKVELVPDYIFKSGLTWSWKNLQTTLLGSYTSQQFSDASNASDPTPNAVEGPIPAYYVVDFSIKYAYRFLTFEGSINNVTNNMYFTRRATGYPGPGIIPSDARGFFVTVQARIGSR